MRSKIEKNFWGGGTDPSPDPSPVWRGYSSPPGFDHIPLHQRFLDPPKIKNVICYKTTIIISASQHHITGSIISHSNHRLMSNNQ